MKTIREITKQHILATSNTSIGLRILISISSIGMFITLIMLKGNALQIGILMAFLVLAIQLGLGAWEPEEDIGWIVISCTWYTVLYTSIAALLV